MLDPRVERRQRVVLLAQGGAKPSVIAKYLDIDPKYVRNVLLTARRNGVKMPRFKSPKPKPAGYKTYVRLPPELLPTLNEQAAARKMSRNDLITLCLGTMVRDHLFTAILDDGVEV